MFHIPSRWGFHGDVEIKGLNSGTLSVSFYYILGTNSVDWAKVDHLESKQLFIVKTQDGSVYTGRLRTVQSLGGRPILIEISEASNQSAALEHSRSST